MTTFYWTVSFKGEFYNRIFKGEATTEESVAIGDMMAAIGQVLWKQHGHAGVTKITATIRGKKEIAGLLSDARRKRRPHDEA
jgi:hypothetical protein